MTKATKEAETSVFWDIYRCSVPCADVASRVVPFINQSLKDLGYSGPVTITAVGILTRVPLDILEVVYSSGVSLTYVDTEFWGIETAMGLWEYDVRALHKHCNITLLSTEPSFRKCLGTIQELGQNIIQELPCNDPSPEDPWTPLSLDDWQSFLASKPAGVSFPPPSDQPGWHCAKCDLDGKPFENLVSHLKENHVTHRGDPDPINTWVCLPKRKKQPMRECKKQKV